MQKLEKNLPSNIEAEEGVLGSILIDPDAIVRVNDFLQSDDFYKDAHKEIYKAMLHLYQEKEPADLITLANKLEHENKLEQIGDITYLASLSNNVPTSGNVEYYGRIVAKKAEYRRLIQAAGHIAALAYEETSEALSLSEEMLFQISQGRKSNTDIPIAESLSRYMNRLDTLHENRKKNVTTGVQTGYSNIDYALGGLQPSDLITLAARPAIGKTSLALNIARNAMLRGSRILFFSLEMGEDQLMRRLHSMEAYIDQSRLRHGNVYDDEWNNAVDAISRLSGCNWWGDYTAGISLSDMRSRARRAQSEHGVDLLIVDYLGLMTTSNGKKYENRVQEVSNITRGLKELARELNVPVLMLAQLNRNVEHRGDKVPQLSDLRESGTVEQDSDVVMFIHCDEDQEKLKMEAEPYNVNVIIAKHRNGQMGIIPLRFIPKLTRFFDIEEGEL